MTEKQMVAMCIKGDRKAQKFLYDSYSRQMYPICLRYCKNPSAATDALQNGFVSIFRNIHKFRNDGSLEGWIKRIVINASLNEIRVSKRWFTEDMDALDESLNYNEMHINVERYDYNRMLDLLETLPDGYRMVFSMHVLDEMSHDEIANALNINKATSRSQLLRARKILQKKIREDKYLNQQYLAKNKTYLA